MNLKHVNDVVNAALPYLSNSGMHDMSYTVLVNGAAIDASAALNDTPMSADFNAPQSLAPSPQNPTNGFRLLFCNYNIKLAFSSGLILAYINDFSRMLFNVA